MPACCRKRRTAARRPPPAATSTSVDLHRHHAAGHAGDGCFGMNVAGLPGTKSDDAFLWVIGGMALLAVLTLLGMRLKRLI